MKPERAVLEKYVRLCRDFIGKKINCDQFRTMFFNLNKIEAATKPEDALKLVDVLFYSVEMCEPDADVLKGLITESPNMGYLNEDQLRERVAGFIQTATQLMDRRE